MSAAVKHTIYFPGQYDWLSNVESIEHGDLAHAVLFNTAQEAEEAIVKLGLKSVWVQSYKLSMTLVNQASH